MAEYFLIVGLGNPGDKYADTRHNVGFRVAECLSEQMRFKFKACSFTKAIMAEGQWRDKNIIILMPMTYMNNSGVAVKALVEKFEIPAGNVLVVYDDFQIPFGQLRLRSKGSDGGHNGLSSVIYHLESEQFPRLRVGIGSPAAESDVDFVLGVFTAHEKSGLKLLIEEATDCCLAWMEKGIDKAMEQFNRRKE